MLAILGGLGAALAWATTTLAASRASRLIDIRSLLASVMLVGLLVAAPAAVIAGVPPALDAHSLAWMAVSGAGNVVGLLFTYAALQIGKVGLVAPITSTEGAVAAVIAVVLGEQLAPGSGVTLAAIAVGVSLAAVSRGGEEVRRSDLRVIVLAAGAALSFGFGLYATGRVGEDLGIAWAVLPPRVVGVVAIAIPLALTRRWRMRRTAVPYVVVAGLCEVLGFASYAVGARHGLAVSAVLASQFAAIAAVVGYFAFHERLAPIQVAGIVMIVAGVSVLSALQA
ncbi:MAG TPA: DMT family transporter [Gaiellaceae bacterium]|jgi:drug/metabolite transporter (DMT)-like permease|nr:DMT family transporter [Gaiellaceae bacterium]